MQRQQCEWNEKEIYVQKQRANNEHFVAITMRCRWFCQAKKITPFEILKWNYFLNPEEGTMEGANVWARDVGKEIEFSWPNRKFIMAILKWCARNVMILWWFISRLCVQNMPRTSYMQCTVPPLAPCSYSVVAFSQSNGLSFHSRLRRQATKSRRDDAFSHYQPQICVQCLADNKF